MYCSCKALRLSFQHSHDNSQPSVTLALIFAETGHGVLIHIHEGKTLMHIKININFLRRKTNKLTKAGEMSQWKNTGCSSREFKFSSQNTPWLPHNLMQL